MGVSDTSRHVVGQKPVGRSHPSMSRRFRYSIRSLLVSIAVFPLVIWWFSLPTIQAHRFIDAVNSQDLEAAQRLLPADANIDFTAQPATISITAVLESLSLRDFYRGKRSIGVWFIHPKPPTGPGRFNGSAVSISFSATRNGVESVEFVDRYPNPFKP